MLELMVVLLCSGNYGCQSATKAYYASSPTLQTTSKQAVNYTKKQAGTFVTYTAPPLLLAYAGHNYQVRLTKRWSIAKSQDGAALLYGLDF